MSEHRERLSLNSVDGLINFVTCATDAVADQFKEFVRSLNQDQLDALAQTIGQFKNDNGAGSGQIRFAGVKTELIFEQGVLKKLES